MDDLFRFWLIRPAIPVASQDVNQLTAGFTRPGMTREEAQHAARLFADSGGFATTAEGFKYAEVALKWLPHCERDLFPMHKFRRLSKTLRGRRPQKPFQIQSLRQKRSGFDQPPLSGPGGMLV